MGGRLVQRLGARNLARPREERRRIEPVRNFGVLGFEPRRRGHAGTREREVRGESGARRDEIGFVWRGQVAEFDVELEATLERRIERMHGVLRAQVARRDHGEILDGRGKNLSGLWNLEIVEAIARRVPLRHDALQFQKRARRRVEHAFEQVDVRGRDRRDLVHEQDDLLQLGAAERARQRTIHPDAIHPLGHNRADQVDVLQTFFPVHALVRDGARRSGRAHRELAHRFDLARGLTGTRRAVQQRRHAARERVDEPRELRSVEPGELAWYRGCRRGWH